MAIITGSVAAGGHGTGAAAESLHLIYKQEAEGDTGNGRALETSKGCPQWHTSNTTRTPHLSQIVPLTEEPNIHIYERMGTFSFIPPQWLFRKE